MSSFVKPKIDQVLYLFSDKAIKKLDGSATKYTEYRWDIPTITLNDWGKISMEGRVYKTLTDNTKCFITRIRNVSTKNNFDSQYGNGAILNIGQWVYTAPNNIAPTVALAPQTLNSITLSFNDDMVTLDNGILAGSVFVIILKITEDDVPVTEWGNSKAVNVRQMQIPTYNNN